MKLTLHFIISFCCICIFFLSFSVEAQLVNIESKRMHTDSLRFVLNSDLLFNYTDNNGEYILQINSNVTTQFKSKNLKSIYFFIGNVSLIRSKDEDFQNSYFLHARFNQKLTDLFRLEAFVQNQYNENLTISDRNLLGVGLRLKILDKKGTLAYLGNSYIYEVESVASSDQKFYNHRNSSYLSLNQNFKKYNLDITGTFYFQPLYDNISNHRILSQFKAQMPLTKRISFSALFGHLRINSYLHFPATFRSLSRPSSSL